MTVLHTDGYASTAPGREAILGWDGNERARKRVDGERPCQGGGRDAGDGPGPMPGWVSHAAIETAPE